MNDVNASRSERGEGCTRHHAEGWRLAAAAPPPLPPRTTRPAARLGKESAAGSFAATASSTAWLSTARPSIVVFMDGGRLRSIFHSRVSLRFQKSIRLRTITGSDMT